MSGIWSGEARFKTGRSIEKAASAFSAEARIIAAPNQESETLEETRVEAQRRLVQLLILCLLSTFLLCHARAVPLATSFLPTASELTAR